MSTTSTSRKAHPKDHWRTLSFSALSTFSSEFSSPPSSPETTLLPLSHQSSPPSSPPSKQTGSPSHHDHLPAVLRTSTAVRWNLIARGVGTKSMRALKRSDLPLLLVFVSCCIVFFQALAGHGYQDPDGLIILADVAAAQPGPDFEFATPLLIEEPVGPSQKELEEVWKTMKRSKKDGAWLLKARDKRFVRRNGLEAPPNTLRNVEVPVVQQAVVVGSEPKQQKVAHPWDDEPEFGVDRPPKQRGSIFDSLGSEDAAADAATEAGTEPGQGEVEASSTQLPSDSE